MSATAEIAKKWTCDRCSMSVSRMDGGRAELPDSWDSNDEGDFCLTCRRERAAEAALEAAPSDSNAETRAKLRRAGLIEFEVKRTPDLADGQIARACRSSAAAVAAARERLQLGEGPPPSSGGRVSGGAVGRV
jgi:hypothetical protein